MVPIRPPQPTLETFGLVDIEGGAPDFLEMRMVEVDPGVRLRAGCMTGLLALALSATFFHAVYSPISYSFNDGFMGFPGICIDFALLASFRRFNRIYEIALTLSRLWPAYLGLWLSCAYQVVRELRRAVGHSLGSLGVAGVFGVIGTVVGLSLFRLSEIVCAYSVWLWGLRQE